MALKDSFASKNGTTNRVSKIPVADINEKIKKEVDNVISLKTELKKFKADLSQSEQIIIDHVKSQQEKLARAGNYSKSFYVKGKKGSLTYVTSDKFTIAGDEKIHKALKSLLGKNFNKYLRYVRVINLTKKIMSDTKLLNKIIKIITDAGISFDDVFEVEDVLMTQPGIDKSQYELSPEILKKFSTMVKQKIFIRY
ncbi:hypothetical protein DRQ07_00625 [candidate division KSB1 bacterium]|nr:MAG: hypothetical protein DRQ07_00625 [candidate division KSB1 bacterium]